MEISLISAISENNVIGKDGKLPWHIKEDLQWFKKNTEGKAIIMGRNTWESIGKPLPKRLNIIVSNSMDRSLEDQHSNVLVTKSCLAALILARQRDYTSSVFIGGHNIYKEGLDYANKLYLTHVKGNYEGDTFFPKIDFNDWQKVYNDFHEDFEFTIYKRIG